MGRALPPIADKGYYRRQPSEFVEDQRLQRVDRVYSVKELNEYLKERLIGDSRLRDLRVAGEISNLNKPSIGHVYFTLKDEESQISCVLFRTRAEETGINLETGMRVVARGSVDMYVARGVHQLVVREVMRIGLGELFVQLEERKEKLAKEGLFDATRKRSLPLYPNRIGVVTSESGAALHDFLNITRRRYPLAEIVLSAALVQGPSAPGSLIQAIRGLSDLGDIDLIVLCRGGGSPEDLWCFNDEELVRAIVASTVPVVSAVGHETDVTLSDLAADVRAPTPSAAASLVVPDKNALLQELETQRRRMEIEIFNAISDYRQRLETMGDYLRPQIFLTKNEAMKEALQETAQRLRREMDRYFEGIEGRLRSLRSGIEAVGPLAVLGRGYSITTRRMDGALVASVEDVDMGESVEVRLEDGSLTCTVSSKEKGN